MAAEPLAVVPGKPVRVKITNPDGSWAKATVSRYEEDGTVELLDESPFDAYGEVLAPEYGEAPQPAKKAAASPKEGDK